MRYVIVDLEWNGCFSKKLNRYYNEIIEIGAVMLDDRLNITGEFRRLIKPVITQKLSSLVKQLTHITQEELKDGCAFEEAFDDFARWSGEDFIMMSWGKSDLLVMLENYRQYLDTDCIPFLKEYVDLQTLAQNHIGAENGETLGLSAAAEALGIDPEGMELHRAFDDSLLSALIFRRVYNAETLREFCFRADVKEFYDRIEFKNAVLKDMANPLVDKKQFRFQCPLCTPAVAAPTLKMSRDSSWDFKGRAFRAVLICKRCGRRFSARVQFKLTYDGIVISRSVTEITESEDGSEPSLTS
ncbi:MAG: exonuclease domain-containing protein [Clostridia bacterium]|nr:exonuclease domain-containing protein [Clostridia bacterium]